MKGELQPLAAQQREHAYALYRDGMHRVQGRVHGWDEGEQRQRFGDSLAQGALFWYREAGQDAALLCLTREPHGLHLHLIVVPPALRRQGIGARAIAAVHALCRPGQCVTLSCFRHDKAVRAFYAAQGYRVARAEAEHLALEWHAPPAS